MISRGTNPRLRDDAEPRYRSYFLAADNRRFFQLCLTAAAAVLLFSYSDYLFFGIDRRFLLFLAARLAFCLLSIWTMCRMRCSADPWRSDRHAFAWAVVLVAFMVAVHESRPPSYLFGIIIDLVIVFVLYAHLPDRFLVRVVPPVLFTLASIVELYMMRQGIEAAGRIVVSVSYVLVNILGINISSRIYESRRAVFLAEEQLRSSADDFRRMLEDAPLALSVSTMDGRILFVNRHAEELFGLDFNAGCDGLSSYDFYERPEDRDDIVRSIKAGETVSGREVSMRTRDDRRISILLSACMISFAGEPSFLFSMNDITRRKAAEESLQKNERLFRVVIEDMPVALAVVDQEQSILFVNRMHEKILGYDEEQIRLPEARRRLAFDEGRLEEMRGKSARAIAEVSRPGEASTPFVARVRCGDGVHRDIEFRYINLGDFGLWVLNDVTVFNEIIERQRELVEMRDRFISVASHEFKTPLNVINTSAELLAYHLDTLPSDKREAVIERIRSSVWRMADLVDNLLSLDRIEKGAVATSMVTLDVRSLCKEVIDGFVRERHVDLEIDAACSTIVADRFLLRQALGNLLSNAEKFSGHDSSLAFTVRTVEGGVLFEIRDKGIGISPGDLSRIGERFYRGSNVGKTSGTGLGLSIVKQSVELMGGSLRISSEDGDGTMASVIIPLQQPSDGVTHENSCD